MDDDIENPEDSILPPVSSTKDLLTSFGVVHRTDRVHGTQGIPWIKFRSLFSEVS